MSTLRKPLNLTPNYGSGPACYYVPPKRCNLCKTVWVPFFQQIWLKPATLTAITPLPSAMDTLEYVVFRARCARCQEGASYWFSASNAVLVTVSAYFQWTFLNASTVDQRCIWLLSLQSFRARFYTVHFREAGTFSIRVKDLASTL